MRVGIRIAALLGPGALYLRVQFERVPCTIRCKRPPAMLNGMDSSGVPGALYLRVQFEGSFASLDAKDPSQMHPSIQSSRAEAHPWIGMSWPFASFDGKGRSQMRPSIQRPRPGRDAVGAATGFVVGTPLFALFASGRPMGGPRTSCTGNEKMRADGRNTLGLGGGAD